MSLNTLTISAQTHTTFSTNSISYLVKQLMAHFLFFFLLFAGQLMGGFSTPKLPPSHHGDILTILSIDGGGIKGILPATVLEHLDKALKVHSYVVHTMHMY